MSDRYTSHSTQGYFSRIGGAIKGVVIGVVLFLASFVVLFWNEGRAVHRAEALKEGAAKVVSVDPKSVVTGNEGKLVHFTGDATGERLADPVFGVAKEGVRLRRAVQMYQWKETKEEKRTKDGVGGRERTETTFKYSKEWVDKHLPTSEFDGPGRTDGDHKNPPTMPYEGESWTAAKVTVGAFTLPADLVGKITAEEPVKAEESMLAGVPEDRKASAVVNGGRLYLPWRPDGKVDPDSPRVGDLCVSFSYVPNGPVTVVAQQSGATLAPYQAKSGTLLELHQGTETAQVFFQKENERNNFMTWVLRGVGFVVMWVGLAVGLNPLKVLADVVGFVGDIVGVGVVIISGLVAVTLSLLTIGVAWVFYRPLLGIGLLAVAAAVAYLLVRLRKQGRAKRVAAAGAMPATLGVNLPPVPFGVPGGGLPPVPTTGQPHLPPVPRA